MSNQKSKASRLVTCGVGLLVMVKVVTAQESWVANFIGHPNSQTTTQLQGSSVFHVIKGAAHNSKLQLAWIEISIAETIVISTANTQRSLYAPLFEGLTKRGAIFASSGGFFSSSNPCAPDGLLVVSGARSSPLANWEQGGVLSVTKDGSISIDRIKKFQQRPNTVSAVQSKPILVYNGEVDKIAPGGSRINRSAIGVTNNGHVIIVGAFLEGLDAVTMREFAEIMKALNAEAALNLEGYMNHIYVPSQKLHLGGSGNDLTCIPSTLQVLPK